MDMLSSADILGPIFACALAVFAVAIGVSRVGSGAMRGMAITKDKAVRKEIFQVMLLASALIEGVALFAIVASLGIVLNVTEMFGG
jgi:F0F1-type ATP synthase membrane subunit c/vacuolar-type H+-ATPase subunit K